MAGERTILPFTSAQLTELEAGLGSKIRSWALEQPFVQPEASLLTQLASFRVWQRIALARERLTSFNRTVSGGLPLETIAPEEGFTPISLAAQAAGQIAGARTVAVWYGLERDDVAAFPQREGVSHMLLQPYTLLRHEVETTPHERGITSFGVDEHTGDVRSDVRQAVRQDGPAALQPFLEFPLAPDWAQDIPPITA